MYLGIDLGTSAVKTVLVDGAQRVIASESRPLMITSTQSGYYEQDPAQWIEATFATLDALKTSHGKELATVQGIGLSGQMHGATLLDASSRPLRLASCGTTDALPPSVASWSSAGLPCVP